MYAKQRGIQKVVKKSTRKRKDLSESQKPDCDSEKDDNKNKSMTEALPSQSGIEKQGGKKVGRKRKNDVKVSNNEKKTKSSETSCIKESNPESGDTAIEGIKNDLPGMSLRRSRKTRQSGSSMSDRETDVILISPDDPSKLEDGGRNSERAEQVENKFPIPSAKEELELKKHKSTKDANEVKQMKANVDIVNETQTVLENSRKVKRVKKAAIKKSSSEEKVKEVDERPMTRHSTRSSPRTLSKRSESISSGSERDFKSQELPLMDTGSQEIQQLRKALNQKLKGCTENLSLEPGTDIELQQNISNKGSEVRVTKVGKQKSNTKLPTTIRKLSSEQDTDIEQQQNISNKGLEVTVTKVGKQESNPELPTTIRKRGRRRKVTIDDSVPSIGNKTAVESGLDTESLNAGVKVLNKRRGKSKLNLPCEPKQIEDSLSGRKKKTDTDFSIHTEIEKEHKKESASNDSLNKDSHNTSATEEESEKVLSDTNIDGVSKSYTFVSKDNDASVSEEKGFEGKKAEVRSVRGRRGRKKTYQSRGRKFGYKVKNSSHLHPANDSEDDGIASNDKGILEVLNQASVAPLIKTKTYGKRMSSPHSNEESGKQKLLKSSPSESSGMVQRVDSMSCAEPNSEDIHLKCDKISGGSDFELHLNKPDTAHKRKNEKINLNIELSKRTKAASEKDELSNLGNSSSNVDSNDKCDSNVKRLFKGKKRRGGVYKRKSKKIELPSVYLAKRKVEQTKTESYLESIKGNFLINDLSVVVEKLDLNDPEIIKLMGHSFSTNKSAGKKEEKTKGIQKGGIDNSIDVNMDTTVDSIVPSSQTSKPNDEFLEKEKSVDASTKNIDETIFLNTEKQLELSENQIPNLEVPVHTENTLSHCDDQESEITQSDCSENFSDNQVTSSSEVEKLCHMNDSKKLGEVNDASDISECDRQEILVMDQDKSANILESEKSSPSERGIQEKQESISNSLDSDKTSICDKNQLDSEIPINPSETTTDNKNDVLLNQSISTSKNKTSSESLDNSCDGSRTSIEEDKTSNLTEINHVPKTRSKSKSLIETEDVFIVLNPSKCSEDRKHSEKKILLSVKQNKMKECYVNMSKAIDISNSFECKKNANSVCEKSDTESKTCSNLSISPTQKDPIAIIDSSKDNNATIEAVHGGQEKSDKELVVNSAIDEVDVTDSGLEDEIVAALEDNREVNDELEEVREVYNAAIKDMKEITGCGLDGDAAQDVDREATEVELRGKNDTVLEDQSKAAQKEISINEHKSGKEMEYDVIKDASENAFEKEIDTLEEVSEKALEAVKSVETPDKINELKGIDATIDASGNLFEEAINAIEEVSEKAIDIIEEVSEKAIDTIEEVSEKAIDTIEEVSEKVIDTIEEVSEKAIDTIEEVSEKAIDTIEEVREKALEETVESDTTLDSINEYKSGKEEGYDVIKDASENAVEKEIDTLEEVSEKALVEKIESVTTPDKINELKSREEVGNDVIKDTSEIAIEKVIDTIEEVSEKAPEETIKSDTTFEEQAKSGAANEQVDGVKELDQSGAVLKVCKTKCDVTSLKDDKNADNNTNLKDLKEDMRDVNLEHIRELKCVTTEKEGETALEDRTEVVLDTTPQDQQKHKNDEAHQGRQAKTHKTLKAQLKSQHINGNSETQQHNQNKNVADESQNKICTIIDHQSKVDTLCDKICEPDADNKKEPDFTKSDMFMKMQKYFNLESPPSNFSSAIKSDMQVLHSGPNFQGCINFNEGDQCVNSSSKLNESKILESHKVPIEQNNDSFECNQSKPGSSNNKVTTAKKRKIDEVEPQTYYWPKFPDQLAWEYLQPFVPVLHSVLDSLLENNPRDPVQYFSQWLNDHKAEAYFMMASMPLSPEFKLKKPKR